MSFTKSKLAIFSSNNRNAVGKEHLKQLDSCLKKSFQNIKEEMNDFRETTNQNTNEIQGNYEYLCKIESRIDKLSERIDEISLFIQQLTGKVQEYENFTVSALTTKEQEVFMAIYTSDDDISYKELGRKTGLTENLVLCYVTNLITKGVRVIKRYSDNEVKISIDTDFREAQAKHNILKINESISHAVIG